jgi:tight adherence protein B
VINLPLVLAGAGAIVGGGIGCTRLLHHRRRERLLSQRLTEIASRAKDNRPAILVDSPAGSRLAFRFPVPAGVLTFWERLLYQSNMPGKLPELVLYTLVLFAGAAVTTVWLDLPWFICLIASVLAAYLPTLYLIYRRSRLKERFVQQLPAAIDLMVSVLKSGHSIPQCVQAVADELPAPCGAEFGEVLQRIYLGQTLPDALSISAQRFASFDLDLIQRAVAIQSEVGGSLADLLEKTNGTIRDRLKLIRQGKALTAQSRLTAIIVALMPFVLAAFLQSVSPGYLNPLIQTDTGRMLLGAAAVLQVIGIFVMKRLATIKV